MVRNVDSEQVHDAAGLEQVDNAARYQVDAATTGLHGKDSLGQLTCVCAKIFWHLYDVSL